MRFLFLALKVKKRFLEEKQVQLKGLNRTLSLLLDKKKSIEQKLASLANLKLSNPFFGVVASEFRLYLIKELQKTVSEIEEVEKKIENLKRSIQVLNAEVKLLEKKISEKERERLKREEVALERLVNIVSSGRSVGR